FTVQRTAVDRGTAKQFPLILTSGRLVDYEGGGEETRSNKWLAELKQDMFVEINPADAAERGIKDGGWVWVFGPEGNSKARMNAPCAAVCPVKCIFSTDDGVVLHSKDLCIGCGYCFYACPFGAPQYPKLSNFGSRGKMDKCTYCAGGGGSEVPGSIEEYRKYG